MRSLGNGVDSATTQVKVLSPEIILVALGQGFHFLEASIDAHVKGESVSTCRGLSPWRDNELFMLELGRTEACPLGSGQGAEDATRWYGASVVGLTHSKGVVRVMPDEGESLLEGVSSLTQRGGGCHATH